MNRFKDLLIILLIIIGVIVAISLALALANWPILLIAGSFLAGGKKAMLLAFGFVAIVVLVQTIKYRNKDIFAESCKDVGWLEAEYNLNKADFIFWRETLVTNGFPFIDIHKSSNGFTNLTVLWAPHQCLCNPCVFYSENGKYKATVYHTYWKNYWLFQKHEFKIVYDHA